MAVHSRKATGRIPAGVGLGLRWEFLDEVVTGPDLPVAFFEVSPENYMRRGGYFPRALERVRDRYSIATHGLALSLGSAAEPDAEFLRELRREIERLGTPWHSDHLSFSFAGDRMLHELLPLAFTRDNAERVAARLRRVEDALGVPMAVENVTYYLHPGEREMSEGEFVRCVLERSGAGLLLDVNNVHVNARNHGFDAVELLESLPMERVVEVHVAGHALEPDGLLLDTHGAPVASDVEALLEWVLRRTGPVPVLLERDNDVPPLDELIAEVRRLSDLYDRVAGEAAASRSGGPRAATA